MIVGFNNEGTDAYKTYGFDDYDEDVFVCREPYENCKNCPAWFMCERATEQKSNK